MPKPKKFRSIEFNIHEALEWDRDNIILALDVIRKKFCETPDLSRHGLTAHIMPRELPQKPGELYPVIGLILPNSKYFSHFESIAITTLFENWKRTHAIPELLNEAAKAGIPTWEQLLKQKTFPIDPRTLYS